MHVDSWLPRWITYLNHNIFIPSEKGESGRLDGRELLEAHGRHCLEDEVREGRRERVP